MLMCERVVAVGVGIGWVAAPVGVHVRSHTVRSVVGAAGRIVVGIRGWVCCVAEVGLG